jgi:hypothetical protein
MLNQVLVSVSTVPDAAPRSGPSVGIVNGPAMSQMGRCCRKSPGHGGDAQRLAGRKSAGSKPVMLRTSKYFPFAPEIGHGCVCIFDSGNTKSVTLDGKLLAGSLR